MFTSLKALISGGRVEITTNDGQTVHGRGTNRAEQLKDAFAQIDTSAMRVCPVCTVNLALVGCVCQACSNEMRR